MYLAGIHARHTEDLDTAVFPDCLGLVIRTAGNVCEALLTVCSKIRGFIVTKDMMAVKR